MREFECARYRGPEINWVFFISLTGRLTIFNLKRTAQQYYIFMELESCLGYFRMLNLTVIKSSNVTVMFIIWVNDRNMKCELKSDTRAKKYHGGDEK